jgi:ABC-type uncharacterized transport system ATPase subunit
MQYYWGDASFISKLYYVSKINNYGQYMEIRLKENSDAQSLFRELAFSSINVKKFERSETSLNDIFIEIVSRREA